MMLERDLCYAEEYYYYRRSYFKSGGFSINAEYSIDISLSLLYKALKRMIEEYPQLSLQVFEDRDIRGNLRDKKVRFMDSYNFDDLVEVINVDPSTTPIENILRQISTIDFKYNEMHKPLWGVKFVRPNNVIFYCDHLFYDGKSGFNFHQILRDNMNSVLFQEERMRKVTTVPDYSDAEVSQMELFNYNNRLFNEIPPQNISIVNYNPTLKYLLGVVYKIFFPLTIQRWTSRLLNLVKRVTDPFVLNTIYHYYKKIDVVENEHLKDRSDSPIEKIHIDPNTLKKLIEKCRSEKVKLTALIMAISHIAILPISKGNDVKDNIPVNLRGIGKYPTGTREFKFDFGCYVSAIDFKIPSLGSIFPKLYSRLYNWGGDKQTRNIEENSSESTQSLIEFDENEKVSLDWSIPRYLQQYIEEQLPTVPQLFGSLQLVKVSDYIKAAGTLPNISTLVVSNLGSMVKSDSPTSQAQITDLVFSQASNHFCGYISLNVVGTDINGVNIVATALPGFHKEFNLFMSLFRKVLHDIIEDL